LVGAGVLHKESTARPQSQLIPSGVRSVRDWVEAVSPTERTVTLALGDTLNF
jgi:hypothetical protein